jgi:hypothetical protein
LHKNYTPTAKLSKLNTFIPRHIIFCAKSAKAVVPDKNTMTLTYRRYKIALKDSIQITQNRTLIITNYLSDSLSNTTEQKPADANASVITGIQSEYLLHNEAHLMISLLKMPFILL